MAIPAKLTAAFLPESFYHIICKSLNNQLLFLSDENKRYFLSRYKFYLSGYADTYAYNLLDNNVHFIIKIKSSDDIKMMLKNTEEKTLTIIQKNYLNEGSATSIETLIERQFNSFFVSYTRSFNIFYKKKGHLFDSPFKRIRLKDEMQTTQAIVYVHANAKKHKLTYDISKQLWSSYQSLISDAHTMLKREEVISWFGGIEGFMETHKKQADYFY